jgi:MFS family permease
MPDQIPDPEKNGDATTGEREDCHQPANITAPSTGSNASSEVNKRLDPHGLPLIPQPTSSSHDPLNWPTWLKWAILAQISLYSLTSLLSASLITPALALLAKEFKVSLTTTGYLSSTFILFLGISSAIWNPIADVYGRRPIYLLSAVMCLACLIACGFARTYAELLVFRALNGVFAAVPAGLGSATVCDLFFEHERGKYLGIYTLFFISGGHVAPIIGGYVEKDLGWRRCFFVGAIFVGVLLLGFVVLPETLYPRECVKTDGDGSEKRWKSKGWMTRNLLCHATRRPTCSLRTQDFVRPWRLLKYPSILLPTLYYSAAFSYGSVLFVITASALFAPLYHFQSYQTGLLLGIPLTLGSALGELFAGAFSDWLSARRAVKRRGERKAEDRLLAMGPALVLLPLGLIIEGVAVQQKWHWVATGMGIGVASVGLQVGQTGVYAYTAECHRPHVADIGLLFSFCRAVFGFAMGFYALPLGQAIGFQNAWIVFASVIVALSIRMMALLWVGERWRMRLGQPGGEK